MTSQKRDWRGVVGHALEHQRGGAVGERPVDDVAVAGDPADIGGAPVDVAVMVVEDILVRHRGIDEIAAGGVQHALRLAGRARRVEDEQRILRLHLFRLAVGLDRRDLVVVPDVAALVPSRSCRRCGARRRTFLTITMFLAAMSIALSVLSLSGIGLAAAQAFVGGDDEGRLRSRRCGRRARPAKSRRRRSNGWRRCACRRASHRRLPGSSACRW